MARGKAPTMDYNQHNSTYVHFLSMVKWGVIGSVVLLSLMAIFLL